MTKRKSVQTSRTGKTAQEVIEDRRLFDVAEIKKRLPFISEPTYHFAIGEKISDTNGTENSSITNILFGGKAYEITFTSIKNHYGNIIRTENQNRFVTWTEIRKITPVETNSFVKNRDLRITYSQQTIYSLLNKVYYFGVDFNPIYQRDHIWETEDKTELLDSIFNHFDIGKFAFIFKDYSENDTYSYEVLDGKQRMRAILDFYEERITYKGKTFSALSRRDQGHFLDYPVSVAEMPDLDKEQILRYFIKLNKCGKIMSSEQIKKIEHMLTDNIVLE